MARKIMLVETHEVDLNSGYNRVMKTEQNKMLIDLQKSGVLAEDIFPQPIIVNGRKAVISVYYKKMMDV